MGWAPDHSLLDQPVVQRTGQLFRGSCSSARGRTRASARSWKGVGALASIPAIPLQALFHACIVMPAVGDGDDTHD